LYPYVRENTRQEILNLVREKQKRARERGDIQKQIELNKIEKVIETGGGILKRENPYVNFTQSCMLSEAPSKPLTLGQVQEKMKECAAKWKQLSEEEKKRLGKGRYEVVNLP
jgi:hypothetical protein